MIYSTGITSKIPEFVYENDRILITGSVIDPSSNIVYVIDNRLSVCIASAPVKNNKTFEVMIEIYGIVSNSPSEDVNIKILEAKI